MNSAAPISPMRQSRITKASPVFMARLAGIFYVINIVTSIAAMYGGNHLLASIAGPIAAASYAAVSVLFYFLFWPVSRNISLVAVLLSLSIIVYGFISSPHFLPSPVNPLVYDGFYCILIGYLIFRSTFLPRFLGALMALAGLGYITLAYPPLGNYLMNPYIFITGGVGEGLLTLWLLVKGVNAQRWKDREASLS
ncbi:MAG: DUF4386 family protein [Terracidiphilus sp.]